MRCRRARRLISLYLAPHDAWLSPGERQALEAHLAVCEPCRHDYQSSREVIALLRSHWQISPNTRALLAGVPTRRIPAPSPAFRWVMRAGAAAACLLLCLLGWWQMPHPGAAVVQPERSLVASGSNASRAMAPAAENAEGPPGTGIRTPPGQIDSLVLAGRHQLVMNGGSELTVEPLVENHRIGCLVRLTCGEICVHVEHDGSRFLVETAHGRATITGTTFDVKATATDTTLVVVEGSVGFASWGSLPFGKTQDSTSWRGAAGAVQVKAGQQSTITAASRTPSPPTACDVAALTAWARRNPGGFGASPDALANDLRHWDLPLPAAPWIEVQTDPQEIDGAVWINENRDWFQRQFPWIFALRDALAAEGPGAPAGAPDYPALLLRSGDIWRFAYPPAGAGRQVEPDPNSLLRAAVASGRDETWFRQQAFVREYSTGHTGQATGAAAFERWALTLQAQSAPGAQEVDARALRETLDACTYLVRTRTLALLLLHQDAAGTAAPMRREISASLQEELRILSWCLRLSYELGLGSPGTTSCECSDKVGSLLQGIRELGALEKQTREYQDTPDNR
jgi:ferric-dicitrate binding protein FerR (iron transport regulator)